MIIDRKAIDLLAGAQRETIDSILLAIGKCRKLCINFRDLFIDRLKLLLSGVFDPLPLRTFLCQADSMVLTAALLLIGYCFDMSVRVSDLRRARVAFRQ